MSTNRSTALSLFLSRPKNPLARENKKISSYYAENVFTEDKLKAYLSNDAYKAYNQTISQGQKISRQLADQIAAALKAWAMEKGTTHYTHWFQPLTGTTAEKHDSFFTLAGNGSAVEKFDGDALVQQEPDASSFPSGGLRATFEARGYTAWDPMSPAFIMDIAGSKTLCIPTVFISYTGEALDHKAPLIRSIEALDKAATGVARYFDRFVNKVTPTLGWEQEYFLIDKAMYYARPDLMASGRTVFGRGPAKGQQLEDHYFGAIPERVYSYMVDLEMECHKLGIPVRTRHNEVAPSQFELAPMFEVANIAVDHNSLLMDLMDRVARRHHLIVLLHEKPFAGINGSGKHNNWSMSTDTGTNLLGPGKTPRNNLQFLTFFTNTIKAVHDHADLLRASIAAESNDYRLGANEAPPAIISVFIGDYLTRALEAIETRVENDLKEEEENDLKLDIHKMIPDVMMDNTDRNRTSPFAFTGNKFEFRAVGSSANCADPMMVLNTIVANQLNDFKTKVDKHIADGEKKDSAILKELRECIKSCKNILFEGDNYSEAWAAEAEKRGLPNIKTTPLALDAITTKKSHLLFTSLNIMNDRELEARHEIYLEKYNKKVEIESSLIEELALNQILPACMRYQTEVMANLKNAAESGVPKSAVKTQQQIVEILSTHIEGMYQNIQKMVEERHKAHQQKSTRETALYLCDKVKPLFLEIRSHADDLELYVEDKYWPLPKYREILFNR
ncbi:MAG: glutamine synthetase III [Saprospiraceae bacterium]|nr:glutamine synthetase III [Candidatus Vicinibacter affinis]MBK7692836.1 glutamine synthetase III [Candidatus Vicinibacter affinis]MBK8402572.1 glutamine synthetase III [Candidatus Vicinibacter affinis]MBK9959870.1 glutamine synthetase III [Candidatus Vicinibacter affinis]